MTRGKFTAARAALILEKMRGGSGFCRAAEMVKITRQTAYNWRRAGRESGRGAKYEFDIAVTEIEAEHVGAAEQVVLVSMAQNTDLKVRLNAATWWLERKLPEEYGRHDKLTIDNGDLAQQLLDFLRERLDAETYDRVLAAIAPDTGEEPEVLQLN